MKDQSAISNRNFKTGVSIVFILFLTISALATASSSLGATVTNTNDDGAGSLRNAIAITPAGGKIKFALNGCPCTIVLTSGDLAIERDLTILGPGADQLTISGNNTWRPFRIGAHSPGVTITVELGGLTMKNGVAGPWPYFSGLDHHGGGIIGVRTNLTVRRSVIAKNFAELYGGGISMSTSCTLTIVESTISNNYARQLSGGGIYVEDNSFFSLIDSTVSGNKAGWTGGGISCFFFTHCQIINSTISGNDSDAFDLQAYSRAEIVNSTFNANTGGGVITNVGSITNIVNSTISGNRGISVYNFNVDYDSGAQDSLVEIISSTIYGNATGIRTENTPIGEFITRTTLRNTIVAGSGAGPDVLSPNDPGFASSGYNLIGNAGSVLVFTEPGDQAGTPVSPIDPQLFPLAMNGGFTRTHALRSNSTAVDGGKAFSSTSDQRGSVRPYDDPFRPNAQGGDGTDIGSFEVQRSDDADGAGSTDFP